mmetsp:Transcript_19366/g.27600  ORF Transcript_19366/g.27600 Transcript_19366/m.27600 type:complete len:156 (-) Transcript_19366:701-1168(-)
MRRSAIKYTKIRISASVLFFWFVGLIQKTMAFQPKEVILATKGKSVKKQKSKLRLMKMNKKAFFQPHSGKFDSQTQAQLAPSTILKDNEEITSSTIKNNNGTKANVTKIKEDDSSLFYALAFLAAALGVVGAVMRKISISGGTKGVRKSKELGLL